MPAPTELPPQAGPRDRLRNALFLVLLLAPVYGLHGLVSRLLANEPSGGLAAQQWLPTFLSATALNLQTLALIMLLLLLLHPRLPGAGLWRWLGLAGLVLLCTIAAWLLFETQICRLWAVFGVDRSPMQCRSPLGRSAWIPVMLARQLQPALLLVILIEFLHRSRQAAEALHEQRLHQLRLEARLAEGQLKLLQAQIEPHFLFNTLANVRRLLRTEAAAAAVMLVDLRRYLEQALPRLREPESTLADEAELVRAYLAVHAVRMGGRLSYRIEVPAELRSQHVPCMSLLTLVENAIKHGLQPLPEGGSIAVVAESGQGRLSLRVADTGRGMGAGSGHGLGLANLRARLRAMHGETARLSLQLNEPRGVCATLDLPLGVAA